MYIGRNKLLVLIVVLIIFSLITAFVYIANTRIVSKYEMFNGSSTPELYTVEIELPDSIKKDKRASDIISDVEERIEEVKSSAELIFEEFPDTKLIPYSFSGVFSRFNEDGYTSILFEGTEYTGGAHRNHIFFSKTFDRKGREISLRDIVESEFYGKGLTEEYPLFLRRLHGTLIDQEGVEKVNISPNDYDYFSRKNVIIGNNGKRTWHVTVDKNGEPAIQIIFPPYDVASFSFGTIRVLMTRK